MALNSGIEWTDATWNPVTGCTRVSAGCDNCYAVRMTKRLSRMGQRKYEGLIAHTGKHFAGNVLTHAEELERPLHWSKGRRIFTCSMSDLFHEKVWPTFVDRVFAVMAASPRHTYQILTKRPENAVNQVPTADEIRDAAWAYWPSNEDFQIAVHNSLHKGWPLRNVWIGVSVEDRATQDERVWRLLEIPAAVRFVSAEPLLGKVDLAAVRMRDGRIGNALRNPLRDGPGVDWVIAGGESGPGRREPNPEWLLSLRDQCMGQDVPFFFKQWGKPGSAAVLDGVEWKEFPR